MYFLLFLLFFFFFCLSYTLYYKINFAKINEMFKNYIVIVNRLDALARMIATRIITVPTEIISKGA